MTGSAFFSPPGQAVPSPVFIVGAPRSGTTMLRLMLDAHPDVAIPPETGFVPAALELGDDLLSREAFIALVTGGPAWPDFKLDAVTFAGRVRAMNRFQPASAVRLFYENYAARFGKRGWGDKTPMYAKHVPVLAAAFPDATIVHIVRDGRDAAMSLREQWFSPGDSMASLARDWCDHVLAARESGRHLGKRYVEITFEDLVRAPAKTLRRLCQSLGWRYDGSMDRYHERTAERISEHEGRTAETAGVALSRERRQAQQAMAQQPPDATRIGAWRTGLTAQECRDYESHAGPLLVACGYGVGGRPLRIVITNLQLTEGTGTEQVTRNVALGLVQRGHAVAVYSPRLGSFAARMRSEGLHLVDAFEDIGWSPDVIHGHHHVETMAALRAFPEARGVFVCHDGRLWADHPPLHPRLMRYVAVDSNCRERLAPLVPPERLRVIGNWFDAERFTPRPPLPSRPKRALFFSNYAGTSPAVVQVLREACESEGITLDLLGESEGNPRADPESVLGTYDLVFAKGKCAIEALATGCAVIVCHERPGPLVTALNMEVCRQWNFGLRLAISPLTVDSVRREIRHYDAEDAAAVSRFVRERCGCSDAISAYERLYDEVMTDRLPAACDGESMNLEHVLLTMSRYSDRCHEWGRVPACGPLHPDQMRCIRLSKADQPESFAPGSQHDLMVHLHNMADVSVSTAAPAPLQLSFQWEREGVKSSHDWESPRTALPDEIMPGTAVPVSVRVVAPMEPGVHRLRLTLVQEGVAWFDRVAPETACSLDIRIAAQRCGDMPVVTRMPSWGQRFLEWLAYARSDGQFQELAALAAHYEPPSLDAYRRCLPPVFEMPRQPLIMAVVIDYLRVSPWPFSRYGESALLLKTEYRGRQGWFPLIMPVTTWIARQGGHHLGFPKFVTPSIHLIDEGEAVRAKASGNRGGPFSLDMRFTPGLSRSLHAWEENVVAEPALFAHPFHVLKPVGVGPNVAEVRFDNVKPPHWESRPGMLEIHGHDEALIPSRAQVLGCVHRFSGGMNLVSQPLN